MRKTIASVVVVFMCLFMFAGCRPKSIEEAIKPADLEKMVDELKENALFKNNYSDAKIEVSGNNVTYKYYYNSGAMNYSNPIDSSMSRVFLRKTQISGKNGDSAGTCYLSEWDVANNSQSCIREDALSIDK